MERPNHQRPGVHRTQKQQGKADEIAYSQGAFRYRIVPRDAEPEAVYTPSLVGNRNVEIGKQLGQGRSTYLR